MSRYNTRTVELSRLLRKNQTPAEKLLWSRLRNRNFHGLKFLRQHVVYYDIGIRGEAKYFIVDFYLAKYRLIIELDGGIHLKTQERDADRSKILNDLGYYVVRFKNEELLDIQLVLNQIETTIRGLKKGMDKKP